MSMCCFWFRSVLFAVVIVPVGSAFSGEPTVDTPGQLRQYFEDMSVPKPFVVSQGEQWESRGRQLRQFVLECAGLDPLPTRIPLDAKLSEPLDHPWCSVRRVSYQLWPHVYATGLLYMPKQFRGKPAPAVLCPHGHWANGNAHPTVQSRCLNLARLGYVVFSSTQHHFEDLELGVSHQTVMIWSNIRALDFLETLPEVDRDRIGVAGASGGGLQAQMMVAVDSRVKAATIAGLTCDFRQIMFPDGSHCSCNHFPNIMQRTDHPEISTLGLPCPVQFLTMNDWTQTFAKDNFPTIQELYAEHGVADRVSCHYFDTGHDYNQTKREYTYRWLERWLHPDAQPVPLEEPATETLAVEAIQQLAVPRPEDRGFAEIGKIFLQQRSAGVPVVKTRADWSDFRRDKIQVLQQLLGEGAKLPLRGETQVLETRIDDDVIITRVAIPSEGSVMVPCWVLQPKRVEKVAMPLEVLLAEQGKDVLLDSEGADSPRELARHGAVVLLPDVRTFGQSLATSDAEPAAQEIAWQRNSIVWGRPVAGMAVTDLQAVLNAVGEQAVVDWSSVKITTRNSGDMAVAALFAMACDSRITSADLDLAGSCFEKRNLKVVPRILLHGDILQWAGTVADRKLCLRNVPSKAAGESWLQGLFSSIGNPTGLEIVP